MGELDGRIAIVTGAGRGIGFAIAERLCKAGAVMIIAEFNAQTGFGRDGEVSFRIDDFKRFSHHFPAVGRMIHHLLILLKNLLKF